MPKILEGKSIVMIKLGALGDVVRTSYFVEALVEKHQAQMIWITAPGSRDLLRYNYHVSSVLCPGIDRLPTEASLVISLDDEYDAAQIASSISCDRLFGAYVDEHDRVRYTTDSALWFDMGLISTLGKERADDLKQSNRLSHAEIFGAMLQISGISPTFFGNPLMEKSWRLQRGDSQTVIGVNPFAGRRWPSKELPGKELAGLLQLICGHFEHGESGQYKIWMFADAATVDRAYSLAADFDHVVVWNTSSGLHQFAAAIAACDYLVSTDSLGLHLAVAQAVPSLSFFAPTSADEIDTFGLGVKVRSTSPDYCSYRADSDNSSLTAARVFESWREHFESLNPIGN